MNKKLLEMIYFCAENRIKMIFKDGNWFVEKKFVLMK